MRTFVIGGCLLLLLLISAAFVGWRRSRAAAAPPAYFPSLGGQSTGPPRTHSPSVGPALVFDPEEHDLGVVQPGETRFLAVPWRRAGPGALRVRAVHSGCGCVVPEGLPPLLEEGARGALPLELHVRSAPGPFEHGLRVITDRFPHDVARVFVRGFVGDRAVL